MDGREMSIVFAKDRRKTSDEMRPRGGGGGRYDSRERDRGYRGGGGGGGYGDNDLIYFAESKFLYMI